MISRRELLFGLAAGVLTPLAAEAQAPAKNPRIGFLSSFSSERERSFFAGFQQGLRELGYSEGKNVFIEQRYAGGEFEKLPGLVMELVRLEVDILVVAGAPAALAAKRVTSVIPIVFPNVADPVAIGLVESLARPGGNVTGLSSFNASLAAKRIELLKEAAPSASRFAALLNPANPTNPPQLKLLRAAALTLGVSVLSFEAQRADEIDRAFAAMRPQRPEALIVIDDPLLSSRARWITELAAKSRLPAIYASGPWADAGGLMSFGTNVHDLYRRAASYVDKILKGAKPGDLPVEQPTKFELVVNLKTTKSLGITIPQLILLRADRVIE